MFKGIKVRKLLDQYAQAEGKEALAILSDLRGFGKTAILHAIVLFQQKKLPPLTARTLLEQLWDDSCVADVVALLGDPYDEVRRVAKELLIKKRDKVSSRLLLDQLKSPSLCSRIHAADLLGRFQDRTCVPDLIDMFNNSEQEAKKGILKVASNLADPASGKLVLSALHDEDWEVRLMAVKCLGGMKAPESLAPLMDIVEGKDRRLKMLALDALEAMGDKRAAKPVLELLEDDDLLVRQRAADCLVNIADATIMQGIIRLMRGKDVNTRRCAVEVLGRLKDPQTSAELLRALKDSDWWVRQVATFFLTELKGENNITGSLIAMTRDRDENIRRCAVDFFYKVADPAAFDALLERLQDKNPWVRKKAARALGVLKDKRAIAPLAALVDDKEAGRVIPSALARIGGNKALGLLQKFLAHPAAKIRAEAIKALKALDAKRAVPGLRDCLQDSDQGVRNEAAKALKALTGKDFQPAAVQPAQPSRQPYSPRKIAAGTAVTEAILVLGLGNSTEIAKRDGDASVFALLQILTDISIPIALQHQYQFMKGTGNGFLMTFSKAENAIRFAQKVLREAERRNAEAADRTRINLRFAVNLGEALVAASGDRSGVAVRMTFRVEDVKPEERIPLEESGPQEDLPLDKRILITENVAKKIGHMKGIISVPVGLFELKGITGLHRIHALRWDN